MGEITSRLRPALAGVVRGRDPKYRDWCAPVFREDARS
jgi:hypothetical protein